VCRLVGLIRSGPIFCRWRPVKAAAARWPKSFVFEKTAGDGGAIDFERRVRSRRGLRLWLARAKSSLPVPVSPRRRTVVPAGAASSTLAMGALEGRGSRL